uniref:Vegetative cell wall protein gp1-like n=1 Tax=Castor canadensis TaxID=51338 RepID=A0A8B7VZQ3_CASCN|nr:vegetative cell wall protein gp1-like [Castor canadensis]
MRAGGQTGGPGRRRRRRRRRQRQWRRREGGRASAAEPQRRPVARVTGMRRPAPPRPAPPTPRRSPRARQCVSSAPLGACRPRARASRRAPIVACAHPHLPPTPLSRRPGEGLSPFQELCMCRPRDRAPRPAPPGPAHPAPVTSRAAGVSSAPLGACRPARARVRRPPSVACAHTAPPTNPAVAQARGGVVTLPGAVYVQTPRSASPCH